MDNTITFFIRIDQVSKNFDPNIPIYNQIDMKESDYTYSAHYPAIAFPRKCIYCSGPLDVFEELHVESMHNIQENSWGYTKLIQIPIDVNLHIPFCNKHKNKKNMSIFKSPIIVFLTQKAKLVTEIKVRIGNEEYRKEFERENTIYKLLEREQVIKEELLSIGEVEAKTYYLGVKNREEVINALNKLSFSNVSDYDIDNNNTIIINDRMKVVLIPSEEPSGIILCIIGVFLINERDEINSLSQYENVSLRENISKVVAQSLIELQKNNIQMTHEILGKTT